MKSLKLLLIILTSAILISACSSNTRYTDPGAVDTTSTDFSSTDLQTTTKKMVSGLLTFPPIVKLTAKERPILFVDQIQNNTDEHIDTNNLSNMVMTELTQSGKFRFVDMSQVKAVHNQLSYQRDSGLVDQKTAIKVGHQLGAQFMLYGSISNIVQRNSSQKSVYFLITMKLLNLQTGIVEWADQKQIRKVQKRATFGW